MARPATQRWLAIALIGPAIGALVMLAVMLVMAPPFGEPGLIGTLPRYVGFILLFGYLAGLLPAIAAATAWSVLRPRLGTPPLRTIVALILGIALSPLLVIPFGIVLFGAYDWNAQFYIAVAGAGAIAMLVTARPWRVG